MLLVDLLGRPAHRLHVGGVLGYVGAGGLELGEEGDLTLHLGVALQHAAVGHKAADDVLGEVRAIHTQEELPRKTLDEVFLPEDSLAVREVLELLGIYGYGVSPHPNVASLVPDNAVLDLGA